MPCRWLSRVDFGFGTVAALVAEEMTPAPNQVKGTAMTFFAKIGLLLTVACCTSSGTVLADTYRNIDELAVTVERQARLLERELSVYRDSRHYSHLLSDTRRLSRLGQHLHDLAHERACLAQLQSELRLLESVFDHLEHTLERVDDDCFRGHCRLTGSTLHLRRLLHSMGLTIYHLQNEVGSMKQWRHREEHLRPSRQLGCVDTRFYQTRPTHWSRGITIGGGSTRFTIRF